MNLRAAAAGLACALTLAGAAHAQQVGSYEGTDPGGHALSVTVAENATSGNLEIVGITMPLPASCNNRRAVVDNMLQTWSWAPDVDIVESKTKLHYYNGFAVINVELAFPDATTATGGRGGAAAVFTTRRRGAAKCFSPWEKFTLSFSGPARALLPAPDAALTARR